MTGARGLGGVQLIDQWAAWVSSAALLVPGAAAWAMMIIGFGGAGTLLRWRRTEPVGG